MVRLTARWVVGCVLVTAALTACSAESGSGDDRPSFSPTTSLDLPSPTRTRTSSPDVTSETTEPAPDDETRTVQVEPSEAPEPSPSPGPDDAAADDGTDEGENTPTWVWWLLGIAAVGAVALVIRQMTRSRRVHAWLAELNAAEAEVDWIAYTLLPGLRRTGSLEQVVGGWLVGAPRIDAVVDRLTVLESSAVRDEDRTRARALRDAVRVAGDRMQELAAPGHHDSWARDLDEVITSLEAAVGPPQPATPS